MPTRRLALTGAPAERIPRTTVGVSVGESVGGRRPASGAEYTRAWCRDRRMYPTEHSGCRNNVKCHSFRKRYSSASGSAPPHRAPHASQIRRRPQHREALSSANQLLTGRIPHGQARGFAGKTSTCCVHCANLRVPDRKELLRDTSPHSAGDHFCTSANRSGWTRPDNYLERANARTFGCFPFNQQRRLTPSPQPATRPSAHGRTSVATAPSSAKCRSDGVDTEQPITD